MKVLKNEVKILSEIMDNFSKLLYGGDIPIGVKINPDELAEVYDKLATQLNAEEKKFGEHFNTSWEYLNGLNRHFLEMIKGKNLNVLVDQAHNIINNVTRYCTGYLEALEEVTIEK